MQRISKEINLQHEMKNLKRKYCDAVNLVFDVFCSTCCCLFYCLFFRFSVLIYILYFALFFS